MMDVITNNLIIARNKILPLHFTTSLRLSEIIHAIEKYVLSIK